MLIDHIEIPVTNVDAARRFDESALGPLGVACVLSIPADRSASVALQLTMRMPT
jgi:hypothetical protein